MSQFLMFCVVIFDLKSFLIFKLTYMTFKELTNQNKPVLIDFFAEWCGPCKAMMPMLDDVKKELGDSVSIIKIDIDKNQQLASKYGVRSVPTLMLYKNGEQLWRQAGGQSTSQLVALLKTHQ